MAVNTVGTTYTAVFIFAVLLSMTVYVIALCLGGHMHQHTKIVLKSVHMFLRSSSSSSFIRSVNIKQSYTAMQYSGAGQQGPRKDTDSSPKKKHDMTDGDRPPC